MEREAGNHEEPPPWAVLKISNGAQCAPYTLVAFANFWSWLKGERLFVTENRKLKTENRFQTAGPGVTFPLSG